MNRKGRWSRTKWMVSAAVLFAACAADRDGSGNAIGGNGGTAGAPLAGSGAAAGSAGQGARGGSSAMSRAGTGGAAASSGGGSGPGGAGGGSGGAAGSGTGGAAGAPAPMEVQCKGMPLPERAQPSARPPIGPAANGLEAYWPTDGWRSWSRRCSASTPPSCSRGRLRDAVLEHAGDADHPPRLRRGRGVLRHLQREQPPRELLDGEELLERADRHRDRRRADPGRRREAVPVLPERLGLRRHRATRAAASRSSTR